MRSDSAEKQPKIFNSFYIYQLNKFMSMLAVRDCVLEHSKSIGGFKSHKILITFLTYNLDEINNEFV